MMKFTGICGLLLLSACDSSSSALQDVPHGVAEVLVGRYAMILKFASTQELPVVGQVSTQGKLFKIADIQTKGSGLKITEKSCHLNFDGGKKINLMFSDASIQSTPPIEGNFAVFRDPANDTLRFSREMLTQVSGATLADPLLDPLPQKFDDPRVTDMDNDGKPGMSSLARVFVLKTQLSYVLRSTHSYGGTMDEPGVLKGWVKDRTDGTILDVSNPFLRPAIGPFALIPDPDASKSTVTLVKIADGLSCSDMIWMEFDSRAGDES